MPACLPHLPTCVLRPVAAAGRGGWGSSGNSSSGGGRGGGRGSGRGEGRGAEAFFSPSMLENPWAHLERKLGLPPPALPAALQLQEEQQQEEEVAGEDGERTAGRLSEEGAQDRPWH